MLEDTEGFLYPSIDQKECVQCGRCISVCPETNESSGYTDLAFAVYAKNGSIREKSSSGGFFPLAAKLVLHADGVVFGVMMENDRAVFSYIESVEDIWKFQGSKYMQAQTDGCYCKVKYFLGEGRPVLFSGTPCQVSALQSYLKKDYKNLITMDFICHGVSSPKIFRNYLDHISANRAIDHIEFRNKENGWNNFSLKIYYEDGTTFSESMRENMYLQSFLKNYNLRPSCFFCRFRNEHRRCDITMGDLWESKKVIPSWNDDKGYSFIILHSKRAENFFKLIQPHLIYQKINMQEELQYNRSYIASPWDWYSRDLFFRFLKKHTLSESIRLTSKDSIRKRMGRKWKKAVYKIKGIMR